jgi:hypothetical protein
MPDSREGFNLPGAGFHQVPVEIAHKKSENYGLRHEKGRPAGRPSPGQERPQLMA